MDVDDEFNKEFENNSKPEKPEDDEKQNRQIRLAFETVKQQAHRSFIDEYGIAHIAVTLDDHLEIFRIDSNRFKDWYRMFIYDQEGRILTDEAINKLCSLARAYARNEQIDLSLRTASITNFNNELEWVYDLTNKNWEFIKIFSNGWSVFKDEIIFRRYSNQRPQVYPSREYESDILDRFMKLVNINNDDKYSKLLLKVYIISLYIPSIQKPVLMLHGSQGSAKSSLQELIKILVDPSIIKTLIFPRDNNELLQHLMHHYIAYYDNISIIREWISDQLCRAVSGSGSSKRQLYTDDDDIIYSFKRCVGFNGINLGATKADLLDRGIIIKLERITEEHQRKPSDILYEFEDMKPQLLGYIFDILVKVLDWKNNGNGPNLNLTKLPRMAEFAEYGEVISRIMGYPDNEFIDAYNENRKLQTQEVLDASVVATAIIELMSRREYQEWIGTPTTLLADLEYTAELLKINTKTRVWPKAPNVLSRRLNELKPSLRDIALEIEFLRSGDAERTRLVKVCKIPSEPSEPSKSQKHAQKQTKIMEDTLDDEKRIIQVSSEKNIQNRAQIDASDDMDDMDDTLHGMKGQSKQQ